MRVFPAAGWFPTVLRALAVYPFLCAAAGARGVVESMNLPTGSFVERTQAELALDQLSARDFHTDHELILRIEIELLCVANPDEREFLLAYLRRQVSPLHLNKARLR